MVQTEFIFPWSITSHKSISKMENQNFLFFFFLVSTSFSFRRFDGGPPMKK